MACDEVQGSIDGSVTVICMCSASYYSVEYWQSVKVDSAGVMQHSILQSRAVRHAAAYERLYYNLYN